MYPKKNIHVVDILGAALGAAVTMYAIWQEFQAPVILIFAFYLGVAEIFIQVRWRITVVCRHCGFDPVLYAKDTKRAVEKVKAHMIFRKNDPSSLLLAPLRLPKISRERLEWIEAAESKEKGSLVSRSI